MGNEPVRSWFNILTSPKKVLGVRDFSEGEAA